MTWTGHEIVFLPAALAVVGIGAGIYHGGNYILNGDLYRASWQIKAIKHSKPENLQELLKAQDPWGNPLNLQPKKGLFKKKYIQVTMLGRDGELGTTDDLECTVPEPK